MQNVAWRAELLEIRRSKDEAFRAAGTPLPDRDRAGFHGLAYYDPDPRYRFEAKLQPGGGEAVRVPRTGGDVVMYMRAGTFQVDLPEGPVKLVAYRTGNEEGDELFVPFIDATCGTETYGGGRYLEANGLGGGRYLVDFNLAYHPLCVYNERFSCPIVPKENRLRVAVRAGERLTRPHG